MQYYQFHIGDYTTSTVHLTPLEDITYRRLIDLYYMTEKPIPNDIPWVSRRLRVGFEDVKTILNEFFTLTDNGWENDRCNEEITSFLAYIDKQSNNGKKGGRPKKNPKKPTANPPKSQTKAKKSLPSTHNPVPITQEEKEIKEKSGYTAEFENFWKEYERKGSKANAFKSWKRITAQDKLDAVEAIPHYFVENPDAKFRKDAERYLSHKLFESILERVNNNQSQASQSQEEKDLDGLHAVAMIPECQDAIRAGKVSNAKEWLELMEKEDAER